MDLTWHRMRDSFQSVEELQEKIIESFAEYVPNDPFSVGYLTSERERWIVSEDDLKLLYRDVGDDKEVRLWCDGKSKDADAVAGQKRKYDGDWPVKGKREKNEDKENDIRFQLEEQHGDKYTPPQYTLWAKFIRMGRHDSFDDPPPIIPLITGKQKGPAQKESLTDVSCNSNHRSFETKNSS